MPGTTEPKFSLTTTFAPLKRQTLAAFMAVDSAPGPTYGTIRVLQLPRNTTVPGPTQVQNNFESEPAIAEQLTLLRRGGADVEFGNLLSLPVSGGLLYVEPVYVRAAQGQGYPLLRKVLVSYGNITVLENTLGQALAAVFSEDSAAASATTRGRRRRRRSLRAHRRCPGRSREGHRGRPVGLHRGEQALAAGDFAAYGRAQDDLKAALDRAAAAQRRITGESAAEVPAEEAVPSDPPADEVPADEAPAPTVRRRPDVRAPGFTGPHRRSLPAGDRDVP